MSSSSQRLQVKKIKTPTLVLDPRKCQANIQRMVDKARAAGIRLRPHGKTAASGQVAEWYREIAIASDDDDDDVFLGMTVSSLSMALYFAQNNWTDITVAFPINILEMETILEILPLVKQLNLLVESIEVVDFLEAQRYCLPSPVNIFIKIDIGYGRTGIPSGDIQRIDPLVNRLQACEKCSFCGFLTHAGHTYKLLKTQESVQRALEIHASATQQLSSLKARYESQYPNEKPLQCSFGDTPTCSMLDAIQLQQQKQSSKVWDEMRPGNFFFYDLEQAQIGSCSWDDIAVAVACPIVAKHLTRRELTLYGGGVHFSKDRMYDVALETTIFGRVVRRKQQQGQEQGQPSYEWGEVIPSMYIRSLSQEHGIVVVPETEDWDDYKVGDLLFVLPVHSCMTADCLKHKGYLTTEGQHIERMKD